jgi:S1-C subfamily serine protease
MSHQLARIRLATPTRPRRLALAVAVAVAVAAGLRSAWAQEPLPAATTASAAAPALAPAELFTRVSPSVWRVQTLDGDGLLLGQGSAVVVAPGQLVTNCHVLAKARRVQVRRDGQPKAVAARLARWDVQRDLCQLDASGVDAPAVPLGSAALAAVGQPAYAIGHPKGLDLTMSAGLVSSLRRNAAGQLVLLQTSAAISGGSSGGGLFNEQGELLGLTTIGSITGDAQNLNFAIPADWIRDLPRRHDAARATAASAPASR